MFDYWNPIKRVNENCVDSINNFQIWEVLTLNCDVKLLFEAQEECLLLNFLHFKSVTLCAVIRSNGNDGVKCRSTGKKCLKLFVKPKKLNSSNQRIPCLMEHYSKGRNEEEELNSANIPLMGLPKGHGWMLITGGTRFYSWIYWQIMNWCKTLKEWSGHLNIVLFQVTDCPWSCLYPYQRRRHSRFASWLLIP